MISEYRGKEFPVGCRPCSKPGSQLSSTLDLIADRPTVYHSSYQNPTPGCSMISTTPPQLTASYVPGRDGDINMPEVISPLPQRIMPEVPSNIQEGLAHLELESSHPWSPGRSSKNFSLKSPPPEQNHHRQQMTDTTAQPGYEYTNQSIYQNIDEEFNKLQRTGSIKFNPFPRTKYLGSKVPLSDDEKGELLERVRRQILKSTNPEVQLAWAQNALLWVDIENEHAIRMATENQHSRSKTPKLEHQLREDAINIIRHLGEQGHPKAEFIKAYWLEFGKFGYGMDKKESFLGYTRAAEKGFARAHYRIGMQYENSNNPTKALEHYRRGVSMHDSASHYRLGMMTLLGQHGTPLDYGRGVSLLRFAAETADENSPQGAYVYGMLIARELPKVTVSEQYVPYDIKEAKKYIEKSAYLGFAKAQVKMGLAYELCQLGCEFDPTLSLHYNALASRQGEAAADMAISKWFLCGYEGLFEKNEELAFVHAQRAASTQLPMAEFAMGYFYEIGMYVVSDLRESEKWYQKAAEHGNVDAIGRINSIKANNALSKNYHEQIAVKRIKSRYGSQRGERPDRFRKRPSVPNIEGEITNFSSGRNSYGSQSPIRKDVIDPQKSYPHPQSRPNVGEVRNSCPGPARRESIDPNIHGGSSWSPVCSPKNTTNRPVSMAPYPVNDNECASLSESLRHGLNIGPQSDRPRSAFGVRPPLNSLKTDVQIHGQSLRSCSEIRPSTSIGSTLSDGGRVGSIEDQMMPTRWENQQIEHQSPTSNNQNSQSRRHEHGLEVSGSNRSNKSVSSINMNKPRISHHPSDHHIKQSAAKHDQASTRRDPIVNQAKRPERLSSANIQAQQNQNRLSQRPPQQNLPPQPGPQPRIDSRASSRPLPSPPVPSPKTAGPKKTGPATFEEMGIPAANKEGECHKLDEDETDPLSPSSHKIKIDQSKVSKLKPEKKIKAEKPKKEKAESKKLETTLTKSAKDVKEKIMTLHGDEAMDLMMNYLREQNRPYSVTEISANLHGKVSKTVADKLLKEMSELGKINAKSTRGNEKGSQWIFWALQDSTDNANPEELSCMDSKIQNLKDTIKELKVNLKSTSKKLESIKSKPTSTELAANVERLRDENKSKAERLESYKNGQIKVVTKEEASRVQKEFLYWTAKRLARKRAFQCLEDYFLESKPREELWEEAGIEEDIF